MTNWKKYFKETAMLGLNKIKERITDLEAVLDALIMLLEKREVVSRQDIQMEILARAQEYETSLEEES